MRWKFNGITLYYEPWDDAASAFTMRQNKISGCYVQLLDGYKPKGTTRLSVSLENEDNIRPYFGSILLADAAFDKQTYWNLDDHHQDLMILETVHRIASLCADKYNWDKERFNVAYKITFAELTI
jgi:hypothetical protein